MGLLNCKLLDFVEDAREVSATASIDITDPLIEACLVCEAHSFAVVIVEEDVELLECAFLGVVVSVADELRAKLQCLDGLARHGAGNVQAHDEDLVLSGARGCGILAVVHTGQPIELRLVDRERDLGVGVLFVDGEVLHYALFVFVCCVLLL